MTEERQSERDSQLSAMFDGELPGGECELLARRLTRDDALRAQWSRYSLIGAALRAERGVALHDRVAMRVQSAISKEATYGEGMLENTREVKTASAPASSRRGWSRFAYPLAGASIAAGVAAVSILWLRGVQDPMEGSLQANTTSPTSIVLMPDPVSEASTVAVAPNNAPESTSSSGDYSTPAPGSSNSLAPPARLANYVVAHSEYSGPLTRRMALLGIVGAEAGDLAEAGDAVASPEPTQAEDNDAR
jgi:sigma-E factor negative regulatory protein RseA